MNIAAKLSDWRKNNLITAEQQREILNYENRVRRPALFYSLMFLSLFCIGIGLMAIISANWENIPSPVKLMADFLLLFLTAWKIWRAERQDKIWVAESLIIFYALLILASIGLVGQIYQLPSEGMMALLFWSGLTFPLIFLCRRPLFPGLWLLGFGWALYDRLYEYSWFSHWMNVLFGNFRNYGIWLFLWLMVALYRLLKQTPLPVLQRAWRWWVMAAFVSGAVIIDVFSVNLLSLDNTIPWKYWAFAVMLLSCLWLSDRKNSCWADNSALTVILLYGLMVSVFPGSEEAASALMVILLLAVAGTSSYRTGQEKMFNLVSILIALRIFGIYLEIFGTLLSTGLGLVVSGAAFMGIAFLWHKLRRKFPLIKEKKHV